MAWVLRRAAQLSRGEIAQILEALLALPHVRWEDRVAVTDGVRALRSGGPGLADHLIRGAALRAGARTLLTFDAQLLKLGGCSTP